MPKTNALSDAFLDLFFLNTNAANIGDATGLRGSSTAGSFWMSLHTSSPGVSGSQTTNETSYTSYARSSVARSSAGWTRTAETVDPTSTISFAACTGGSATITHAGIGSDSSGAGHLWMFGTVTPNIAVSNGITPQLLTTSTITES